MNNSIEKADQVNRVAEMYMSGMKPHQIAEKMGLSSHTITNYIKEYEDYIKHKAQANPDMFDKILENSLKFIEEWDYMIREATIIMEEAKENGLINQQLQALKMLDELRTKKARLFQLFGSRVENAYIEKAKRAERVNEMLSGILKDVVSDCPRCRPAVEARIGEGLMGRDEGPEYEEGEIIESVGELGAGDNSE